MRPPAGAQVRPVWRIHRLLRLSGVQVYSAAGHRRPLPALQSRRGGGTPLAAGPGLFRMQHLPGVHVHQLGPAHRPPLPSLPDVCPGDASDHAPHDAAVPGQGLRIHRGRAGRCRRTARAGRGPPRAVAKPIVAGTPPVQTWPPGNPARLRKHAGCSKHLRRPAPIQTLPASCAPWKGNGAPRRIPWWRMAATSLSLPGLCMTRGLQPGRR